MCLFIIFFRSRILWWIPIHVIMVKHLFSEYCAGGSSRLVGYTCMTIILWVRNNMNRSKNSRDIKTVRCRTMFEDTPPSTQLGPFSISPSLSLPIPNCGEWAKDTVGCRIFRMTSFASHLRMYGEISKWPGMYIKIIRLSDIDIIHVGNNNNSAANG